MSLYQTNPLQVYNSLSGKKENFKSIHEGQMWECMFVAQQFTAMCILEM